MEQKKNYPNFGALLNRKPQATALLEGSERFPDLKGRVRFWQTVYGVLAVTEMMGLPTSDEPCEAPIFGLHIHEGNSCEGTEQDPFSAAGSHANPDECPHPYHAGDLPPLFGAGGYAFSMVLTDRFALRDVIGKTVILHGSPDDFTTQPAGNAGERIACGKIMR